MKKFLSITLLFMIMIINLSIFHTTEVFAAANDEQNNLTSVNKSRHNGRVIILDDENYLNFDEKDSLINLMRESADKHRYDIAIQITRGIEKSDLEQKAQETLEKYRIGPRNSNGGLVLILDMTDRNWAVVTQGPARRALTRSRMYEIEKVASYHLEHGDLYKGIVIFDREVEKCFTKKETMFLIRAIKELPALTFASFAFVIFLTYFIPKKLTMQLKDNAGDDYAEKYIKETGVRVKRTKDIFRGKTIESAAKYR